MDEYVRTLQVHHHDHHLVPVARLYSIGDSVVRKKIEIVCIVSANYDAIARVSLFIC
jgi:hypothetical protein